MFQFFVGILIITSFALVFAVPFLCSSQELFNQSKKILLLGFTAWFGLVLTVGISSTLL